MTDAEIGRKAARAMERLSRRTKTRPGATSGRCRPDGIPVDLFAGPELEKELRGIILNIAQTSNVSAPCVPKYHKTYCGCGYKIHRLGCRKRDCPECADVNGKRRARNVRRKLEPALFDGQKPVDIGYLVITIPPRLRPGFADKKKWRRFVCKVWKLLKTKYHASYAVECSHISGDRPEEMTPEQWEKTRVFHPHLNFLWVAVDGRKPYLNYREFRRDLRLMLKTYETPVFQNRYYRQKKQVRQKIRYVTRLFPGFGAWLGPVRWFGDYPRAAAVDPFKGLCSKCGKELVFFGKANSWEYEEFSALSTGDVPGVPGDRAGPDWEGMIEKQKQFWRQSAASTC